MRTLCKASLYSVKRKTNNMPVVYLELSFQIECRFMMFSYFITEQMQNVCYEMHSFNDHCTAFLRFESLPKVSMGIGGLADG